LPSTSLIASQRGSQVLTPGSILFTDTGGLNQRDRKLDMKCRSLVTHHRTLHLYLAAMILNNSVGDRKPKAGPFANGLGGKERIKDPFADLFRDTVPGILNGGDDLMGVGLITGDDGQLS